MCKHKKLGHNRVEPFVKAETEQVVQDGSTVVLLRISRYEADILEMKQTHCLRDTVNHGMNGSMLAILPLTISCCVVLRLNTVCLDVLRCWQETTTPMTFRPTSYVAYHVTKHQAGW